MALPRVAIIASRYNASITDALRAGAVRAYAARGGRRADLEIVPAPGSFELVPLAHAAALTGRFAGVLALGCIIKGETSHDRHLATAVANGLVNVAIAVGIPVSFGVLTVDSAEQARDRAGGAKGNKGEEAMGALLDTLSTLDKLTRPERSAARRAAPRSRGSKLSKRPDKAARSRYGRSR